MKKGNPSTLTIIGAIVVFLFSFGLNLIPFAGPSNMIIAGTVGYSLDSAGVITFLSIGIITALGATAAKSIHYGVAFFISKHLKEKKNTTPQNISSENRLQRFISKHLKEKKNTTFEANTTRIKKWAFLSIFLAAATPIPDEPIVITLGLTKYSITKFCIAFFAGKLSIAVLGAFLGNEISNVTPEWVSSEMIIAMSVALTIIMMIILLKVDLGKFTDRLMGKKTVHKEDIV
jgi:membrane protein DedA with SNARE-associated domain